VEVDREHPGRRITFGFALFGLAVATWVGDGQFYRVAATS
jgi:hypothetical protein